MSTQIELYQKLHIPQVKQFNERLKAGNVTMQFPESNFPSWLPKNQNSNLYQEYFLAFVNEKVRGGYILKHQDFFINGQVTTIADYQLPLSEGIVNPDFSDLGILLTINALKKSPMLFAMGMGGFTEKLPKLLGAMGWKISEINFHFMVLNPFNFLRKITFLRKKPLQRFIMDLLAYSGVGWFAIKAFHTLRRLKYSLGNLTVNQFVEFDEKADLLWDEVKNSYKLIAVRDSNTLNILYTSPRFKCLEIIEDQKFIGWVVLLDTNMKKHKQFGSMRVGSVVDCLSHPNNASKILNCATNYLIKRKVDIIVANHSHIAWNKSFNQLGYIEGPSNYLFAASRDLAKHIKPFDENKSQVYFMRGDGDGPINL